MASGKLIVIFTFVWGTSLLLIGGQNLSVGQVQQSSAKKYDREGSKKGSTRAMFTGINVQRHVPMEDLPEETIVWACEVQYRLIGPDVRYSQLDTSGLRDAMHSIWTKTNLFTKLELRLNVTPAALAPGSDEDPCSSDERSSSEACRRINFGLGESYHAIDVGISTGVRRETQFPAIGATEWTFNRMLDVQLRQLGFVCRVLVRYLRVLPEGLHVLKHVPFTALYAEETLLQLDGLELLPFSLAKQNMLYVVLDGLELHATIGLGWLNIHRVSEAWCYTPARGDLGIVNVTLRTMRDRTGGSIGEAITAALPKLLDHMDEIGLPRVSGRVLWSRPIDKRSTHSPQDQIAEMLGASDSVRAYDLRAPRGSILEYPAKPWTLIAICSLALLGAVTMFAGVGGSWLLFRRKKQTTKAPPRSPYQADVAQGLNDMKIFGRRLGSLKKSSALSTGSLRSRGSSHPKSSEPSDSGSFNPFRSPQLKRTEEGDIKTLGDSATETAGLEGLTDSRRRAQISVELERATSLKGWEIPASAISICTREDGNLWLLGSGGYGQVYRGLRSGVQDVAVKVLSYTEELEMQQFKVEINLLKSVSFDRNIVQFYGCVLDEARPMLILELMEGGDLRSALSAEDAEELGWYRKGKLLAMDIVRGLCYLHENRVVHGDLKTKNVLLTRNGAVAKLSDVGMARVMATNLPSHDHSRGPAGTFAYAAPELLLGQRLLHPFKVDIFSFGVVLWEILTHEVPIRGHLRQVQVPEECPESISKLIDCCLLPEPEDRPTAKQIFAALKEAGGQPPVTKNDSSGSLRCRLSLPKILQDEVQ